LPTFAISNQRKRAGKLVGKKIVFQAKQKIEERKTPSKSRMKEKQIFYDQIDCNNLNYV
jgi:hypothetical protein